MLRAIGALTMCLSVFMAHGRAAAQDPYRWDGHDFVFCFVTDDGTRSNLAWADTAVAMDFRFTMAVNARRGVVLPTKLTPAEMHDLQGMGFEIGQHGRTHGEAGLTTACAYPQRGSLMGYFLCPEPDAATRMLYLKAEIERDTLAAVCDIPAPSIRVVAYPRHMYCKALIDSLRSEGFIGARTGGGPWAYEQSSNGDFNTAAPNSWDGGIALYRLPLADMDTHLFGNHSATPPVHKTYEEFVAVAQPLIDQYRASGGVMVIYTHHLGDHDDSYGNINYGGGGITKRDLAWLVDLVRANNGAVMTFGDALAYYRSRSHMEDRGGDLVWVPGPGTLISDVAEDSTADSALRISPNPFNAVSNIEFDLASDSRVSLKVYDLRGQLVAGLEEGTMSAGHHSVQWSARDSLRRAAPAGIYVVELRTAEEIETELVTLLK